VGTTGLIYEGATANGFETLVTPTDPTADRTITLPDASGTVALVATQNVTFNLQDIATGDIAIAHMPAAATITRVNCWTDAGSVATVNINKRAQATPLTAGTDVTTTAYTCDSSTINTGQTINSSGITAGNWLRVTFGTITPTVKVLVVSVDYTVP